MIPMYCDLQPSGAGKTSFLSILTLEKMGGEVTGEVTFNGHTVSLSRMARDSLVFHSWGNAGACLAAGYTTSSAEVHEHRGAGGPSLSVPYRARVSRLRGKLLHS